MAGPSPHPPPSPPPPDTQELPPEAMPSAEADQEVDIAGTEADEPPIGEAVEDEHRRTPAADARSSVEPSGGSAH